MIKEVLAAGVEVGGNLGTGATAYNIKLQQGSGKGITGSTEINQIIANALTIITTIAVIAVLAMLLFGALQWIISGGEKEKVAAARGRITNALIGLAILGLAFVIVTVVGTIIGVDVLQDLKIPSLGQTNP